MATKKTTTTTARKSTGKGWLIRACSYFALIIAAFMFLFGGIFSGKVQSVLNLIGQLFMLIGIGIPAYDYTRGKKIAWKVIYWVALAIYLFGCVFGIIRAFECRIIKEKAGFFEEPRFFSLQNAIKTL